MLKKMSYAGCPGPSPAISAQFTLKMCVAAGNRKKFTKTHYFGGSRLFKDIDVDTNKKLVMISSTACLCISATVFTLDEIIAVE